MGFQGNLARLDPSQGRIRWARELSSIAGFQLDGDDIFVADVESNVWSISRRNGDSNWKQDALRARHITAPVSVGDYVMVGDLEGYVHWLSQDDGRLLARTRVDKSRIVRAAALAEDVLFVQTEYGLLAALRVEARE